MGKAVGSEQLGKLYNGKSEVLLMTEHGEVLIEPHEVKHCLNEFNELKEKIDKLNLKDLTIFM